MNTPTQTTALASMSAFEPANLDQALALATRLAESNLLPKALQKRPSDVLVVMMMGRDLGLSAMQALRNIHVIDGRPSTSAEMMVALCLTHPEVCEYFTLVESSDVKATYRTKRKGAEPVSMSYTFDMATKAKLTGKQNWQNHPASMLLARASSRLARAVYPDLTNGIHTDDEMEDEIVVGPGPTTPSRPGAARAAKDVTPASATKAPANPKLKKLTPEVIAKGAEVSRTGEYEDAQPAEAEAEPHDAETGEVQAAGDVPWDAEQEQEAKRDELLAAIAAAATVDALKALVPALKELPEVLRDQTRGAYNARLEALKSASVEREPGSEG